MFELFIWAYVVPLLLNVAVLLAGMGVTKGVPTKNWVLIWVIAFLPFGNWWQIWIGMGPFCSNFCREFKISFQAAKKGVRK